MWDSSYYLIEMINNNLNIMKRILSNINRHLFMLIGILIVGFASGCKKDWFDAKPDTSLAVPSTLKDYEYMLDNTDLNVLGTSAGDAASDGILLVSIYFQYLSANEINVITWSHDKPYLAFQEWTRAYTNILRTNIVLDGLKKISPSNNAEIELFDGIKGNALFHRAKLLFELAQIFAPPYSNSTTSSLGIPLKLESDINIPSTRSTVQETYAQITKDLLVAINLLPSTPKYKTRAAKPAAYALLSRVFLSMENYQLAGLYADSCLQKFNALIDYNKLNSAAAFPFGLLNEEVILHTRNNAATFVSLLPEAQLVDVNFYNKYDVNDLRRNLFF
jgi:hypothetical protein